MRVVAYRVRLRARWAPLYCLLSALPCSAVASAADTVATLAEELTALRALGLQIIYSDALVPPALRITADVALPAEPLARVDALLAPHALRALRGPGNILLVVRAAHLGAAQRAAGTVATLQAELLEPEEEILVTASRYRLSAEDRGSALQRDVVELGRQPDVGEDPMRAIARLPGAVASLLSAAAHLRGGALNENLYRYDGLRLNRPFHLRDFANVFSAINPATISGVTVYSAGFPAAFGDRMSAVIDFQAPDLLQAVPRELALSLFNVGAHLHMRRVDGRFGMQWAARRSTYDLLAPTLANTAVGPGYREHLLRSTWQLSDRSRLTAGLLALSDGLEASDVDVEESAAARNRDHYYWLKLHTFSPLGWSGTTVLSHSMTSAVRAGSANLPGVLAGELREQRGTRGSSLQSDWQWLGGRALLSLGAEFRDQHARHSYRDFAQHELIISAPGAIVGGLRQHDLEARFSARHYGGYAMLDRRINDTLTLQAGVRTDGGGLGPRQGFLWSPRLALEYQASERTAWRLSAGIYRQAQSADEIAVSDGDLRVHRAQRSRHLIAGWNHRTLGDWRWRVEAFRKDYRDLAPHYANLLLTVVLLPELRPDRLQFAPTAARVHGAELSMRGPLAPGFELQFNASGARAVDRIAGSDIPRAWDQALGANLALDYHGPRWELAAAWAMHTGRPSTELQLLSASPAVASPQGGLYGKRLRSSQSIDFRIARRFELGHLGTLSVYAEAANVAAYRNPCCVEFEVNADDGALALNTETLNYPRRVASLGVRWQF